MVSLALAACAVGPSDDASNDANDLTAKGKWAAPVALPVFAVHAALLPTTGKVLFFSGDAQIDLPLDSFVWDPATGATTRQTYGENLFCSGLTLLDDGRVLTIGGAADLGVGMASAYIFDPATSTWTKKAPMRKPRWYPTAIKMADGRVLGVSGRGGETAVEVYDPKINRWEVVAGLTHPFDEYYPALHLLPTGEIFNSGAGWTQRREAPTGLIKLTGPARGTWKSFGQQEFPDRQEGAAVLSVDATTTPPKVVVTMIGGGLGTDPAQPSNRGTVETIDLSNLAAPPQWKRAHDLHFGRTNVNAVVLPNGTILAIGGQTKGKKQHDPGAVKVPELYDPLTDKWTDMPPMKNPRQYHSTTILLPDGRVVAAGGIIPEIATDKTREGDQFNLEIFSPPYLSATSRPSVTTAPAKVVYGSTFEVGIDVPAADIQQVTLLTPQAVTHHTDGDQRFVRLKVVSSAAGKLQVAAPANGNIAPPGFYMLSVVNQKGIPSVSKFVHVGSQ